MTTVKDALRTIHRDVRGLRKAIARVNGALDAIERRAAQTKALQEADHDVTARIARLEEVFDLDGVSAHGRSALRGAQLQLAPVPYLVVPEVLPGAVYAAVLDAMPAPLFFDEEAGHATELPAPPRLAPTHTILTAAFLNEIVRSAWSPVLVELFGDSLATFAREQYPSLPPFRAWDVEISLSQPRLVRRSPGSVPRITERPWDLLTGVLMVAMPGDTADFGVRFGATRVPFQGNTLVIFNAPSGVLAYETIPDSAPAETARYSYEFGIGPTREGRRRLEAMMRNSARTA